MQWGMGHTHTHTHTQREGGEIRKFPCEPTSEKDNVASILKLLKRKILQVLKKEVYIEQQLL